MTFSFNPQEKKTLIDLVFDWKEVCQVKGNANNDLSSAERSFYKDQYQICVCILSELKKKEEPK